MPDYVPNTIVRVLKDVPLDDTYSDTIKFNSAGAQSGYFAGKAKYTFTNMTYQRVNNSVARPRGPLTVRVPMIADNLYDCNYIMFQNSNYGQKWFYAFIKQVNYINPENTEIVYEIDYMQTFMMDFEVKECFVEREHVADDSLFANLVPEPISVDNYVQTDEYDYYMPIQEGGPYIVLAVANDQETAGTIPYGTMYGGIYSGLYYYYSTSEGDINSYLQTLNDLGKIDLVAAVYMSPIPPTAGGPGGKQWNSGFDYAGRTVSLGSQQYTFSNNKILSYPFTYYKIRSTTGDEQILKPQLCDRGSGVLGGMVFSSSASEPNFAMVPNYDGTNADWNHAVGYSETVQCAWSKNAYATWQAQNGPTNAFKMMASVAQIAGGLALAPATGGLSTAIAAHGVGSGLSALANLGLETDKMRRAPDQARGTPISASLNMAIGRTGFEAFQYKPHPQDAKRLDEFFNAFGYEVDSWKVPEMESRVNFNYVKTRDANITGSVPVEGMAIIKAAFNSGIRLWHGDITRSLLTAPNPIVSRETNNSEVKSK